MVAPVISNHFKYFGPEFVDAAAAGHLMVNRFGLFL